MLNDDDLERRMKLHRKKLLIYPQFQLLMIAINLATYFLTFFGIFYFFSEKYIFGALIFGAIFSSVATLILSNKLAGPIVRLHLHFKFIAEGGKNIPAVFFRKGDFFTSLPPLINSAMDRMKKETEAIEDLENEEESTSSKKKEAA